MEGVQNILITGPELGHERYEASFLENFFWEFKQKVGNIIEVWVSQKEVEFLRECDYTVFCREIKEMIAKIV